MCILFPMIGHNFIQSASDHQTINEKFYLWIHPPQCDVHTVPHDSVLAFYNDDGLTTGEWDMRNKASW